MFSSAASMSRLCAWALDIVKAERALIALVPARSRPRLLARPKPPVLSAMLKSEPVGAPSGLAPPPPPKPPELNSDPTACICAPSGRGRGDDLHDRQRAGTGLRPGDLGVVLEAGHELKPGPAGERTLARPLVEQRVRPGLQRHAPHGAAGDPGREVGGRPQAELDVADERAHGGAAARVLLEDERQGRTGDGEIEPRLDRGVRPIG